MPKYAIDGKPDGSQRRIIEAPDFETAKAQAKPGEIVGQFPESVTESPHDGGPSRTFDPSSEGGE